jgi:transcriptional regulator with XRE-family HTH domain
LKIGVPDSNTVGMAIKASTELGQMIRKARTKKGLALRAIRSSTGISLAQLHGIEAGTRGPKSPEQVITLARAVGADERAALAVTRHVPDDTTAKLLGPRLRRTLTAGSLSKGAEVALREQHLRALAEEFRPPGSDIPVAVDDALYSVLGVDYQNSMSGPLFENAGMFLVPEDTEPSSPRGRMLLAHAAGHVMLARDSGASPNCDATGETAVEHEADFLAALFAVPPTLLRAEFEQVARDHDLDDDDQLGRVVVEIAAAFVVPARIAAIRLASDGHLGPEGWLATT